jgi:tyrosyl-tRNA synthetase
MTTNFIDELRQRNMLHDVMPGTEAQLTKESTAAYIGFDPTADSLHVGSLAQIMVLVHFQHCGHKPIALVGGATGMVGDPSGKAAERKLLSIQDLDHNVNAIRKQLEKFLDFDCGENSAVLVNNHDWFKDMNLLQFLRDVGKHLSVNYMMAKDSVKSRLETGISFTEFSYQLLQGYDFYHLYHQKNVKLQMGGSDQWGNITAGTELIRRMGGGDAYAATIPLITKADGTKFGKSEGGENIWLDAARTSPYKFYQFWLNVADDDAVRYIKIFTLKTLVEINELIAQHTESPHLRLLQKTLAQDLTVRVHSQADYDNAVVASDILFGKGTTEQLQSFDEATLLSIFDGLPQATIDKKQLDAGINIIDLLADATQIFGSRGECRKMITGGGISINKTKTTDADAAIDATMLLNSRYLLVQKGKKNYHIIIAE